MTEIKHVVYQGADTDLERSNFYSIDESFASDYGIVKKFNLVLSKPFNSADREHIKLLLDEVGYLVDSYDGTEYESYEELDEKGLLGMDTWEIFEPHSYVIKSLGFDGMIIYEGGSQNFLVFNKENSISEL